MFEMKNEAKILNKRNIIIGRFHRKCNGLPEIFYSEQDMRTRSSNIMSCFYKDVKSEKKSNTLF